jgi:hypothetical protein
MSRKVLPCCLVLAALLSTLVSASPATAIWTTNGDATGVQATATAGSSKLAVAASGAATQGISCERMDRTWNVTGNLSDGHWDKGETGFTTCLIVGQAATARCDATEVGTALSYAPVTNVTSYALSGISCRFTKASGACGNSTTVTGGITVTGSVNAAYGNTSQQLTIATTGQSLAATWSSPGCLQGTGSSGAPSALTNGSGTALIYSVTSSYKPQISN